MINSPTTVGVAHVCFLLLLFELAGRPSIIMEFKDLD